MVLLEYPMKVRFSSFFSFEKLLFNKLFLFILTELICNNMTNLGEEIMNKETWKDEARVELIIDCMKHDVNTADISGETILMKSTKENHTDMVRVLLGSPFLDVNKGTEDGTTALHMASMQENFNVIKLLLSHPNLDPNQVNNNYMTGLMEASHNGHFEVVELLLRHPAIDVNKVNLHRKSALFFACEWGRLEVVRLLLRCPTTKTDLHDEDEKIAAMYASNYTEIIQSFDDRPTLIGSGHTCCSEDMKRGLQISAKNGHLAMTRALMKCNGMDLNNGYGSDRPPLYIASRENNFDIVETLLLDSKIDINRIVNGETALLAATEEGHAEAVRILLLHPDIDTNIGKRGNAGSALFIASEIGHSGIVQDLLLQPQIDVNNRYGIESMTALAMASMKGYLNVVKLLLRCPKTQFNINEMDIFEGQDDSGLSYRNTLLKSKHTCCLNKNAGLLKAAISGDHRAIKGLGQCPNADINTVDAKGRTPLYLTSLFGHAKATEELLKQENIDFNKGRRIDGLTPFSIASLKVHVQIMRILIQHSYKNDLDIDNGWLRDVWTITNTGYDLEQYTTATKIYPTSNNLTTG